MAKKTTIELTKMGNLSQNMIFVPKLNQTLISAWSRHQILAQLPEQNYGAVRICGLYNRTTLFHWVVQRHELRYQNSLTGF